MANKISVPEKTWTIVAQNVTCGRIYRPLSMGQFAMYFTTRPAGSAAPVDSTDSGKIQPMENIEQILSDTPIDVYVFAENSDDDSNDTAEVIVEL